MKKVLLFISMLLAAVLITGLYSCTQDGGDNDNRHRQGETDVISLGCKNFLQVTSKVDDYYNQCKSMEELVGFLPEIKKIDIVENAYFSGRELYITIKDYGTMSYAYDEEDDEINGDQISQQLYELKTRAAQARTYINPDYGLTNAIVSNQQYTERDWTNIVALDACQMLLDIGVEAKINNTPDVDFFKNQIFDYDIVFHIGHGSYDEVNRLHWFPTTQVIPDADIESLRKEYTTEQVAIRRKNNQNIARISEKLIGLSQKRFKKPGKAIFIAVPCQTLMGGEILLTDPNVRDYAFADTLINKGLGFFMGYDESNGWGQMSGLTFIGKLVSGMTVENSFNTLPDNYRHDQLSGNVAKFNKKKSWTADLLPIYSKDYPEIVSSTLTRPVMDDIGDVDPQDNTSLNLMASAVLYREQRLQDLHINYKVYQKYLDAFNWDKFTYGFEVSESSDFKNAIQLSKMPVDTDDNKKRIKCSYAASFVHFSQTISVNDLKPETKYYFRAFFNDGTNYNYSKAKEFTTPKQERIEQVIPKEILETMEPYITIYEGDSPPVVEGVYVISPNVISYDSTNGFDAGDLFADHYLKFSNQDILKNTLDFEGKEVVDGRTISYEGGPGAFISGTGDNFTVFFDVSGTAYFDEYNVDYTEALVISGTLTSTGIKNAEYSFVLTWKGDDPKPYAIKKGDFRVFKDNDGLASKATWPSGARRWGWDYKVKDGKITTPWSIYAVRK